MKVFLVKIAFFSVLIGGIIFGYQKGATLLLTHYQGANTKESISYSFENASKKKYDLFIMGNSKFYRGINPDKFSVPAYNFSYNHESFNQIYYKLFYLKKQNISFKYVLIGMDYFQFSIFSESKNYAFGPYFNSKYFADYPHQFLCIQPYEKMRGITRTQLVFELTKKYLTNIPNKPLVIKNNGQLIVDGISQKQYPNLKKKNAYRLPIQEYYFLKIIDLAKEMNIKIVFAVPPIRPEELDAYSSQTIFEYNAILNKIASEQNCLFLNYSKDSNYTYTEYQDNTHLNIKGADLFSTELNDTLKKLSFYE